MSGQSNQIKSNICLCFTIVCRRVQIISYKESRFTIQFQAEHRIEDSTSMSLQKSLSSQGSINQSQLLLLQSNPSSFRRISERESLLSGKLEKFSALSEQNPEYLYTPTQCIISNLLSNKKEVEDDLIEVLKAINETRQSSQKQSLNKAQLLQMLKQQKNRLISLKRKLNKSLENQTSFYDTLKKRVHTQAPSEQNSYQQEFNNFEEIEEEPLPQKLSQTEVHSRGFFPATPSRRRSESVVKKNVHLQNKILEHQKQISEYLVKNQESTKQGRQGIDQFSLNKEIIMHLLSRSIEAEKDQEVMRRYRKTLLKFLKNSNKRKSQLQSESQEKMIDQPYNGQLLCQEQEQQVCDSRHIGELPLFFKSKNDPLEPICQAQSFQNCENEGKFKENKNFWALFNEKINYRQFIQNRMRMDPQNSEEIFNEQLFMDSLDLHSQRINSDLNQNANNLVRENPILVKDQFLLECKLLRKMNKISEDVKLQRTQVLEEFISSHVHLIRKHGYDLQFWFMVYQAVQKILSKDPALELQAIELIRVKIVSKFSSRSGQLPKWQIKELEKVAGMVLKPAEQINLNIYLNKLSESFLYTFQNIYRLPDSRKFMETLFIGGLTLKTPMCGAAQQSESGLATNLKCPVCDPLAKKIFDKIPILTKNQSTLICRINNSIMGGENYPIMLPSNQIYSKSGLQSSKRLTIEAKDAHTSQYYCQATGTWYSAQDSRRVFLA